MLYETVTNTFYSLLLCPIFPRFLLHFQLSFLFGESVCESSFFLPFSRRFRSIYLFAFCAFCASSLISNVIVCVHERDTTQMEAAAR